MGLAGGLASDPVGTLLDPSVRGRLIWLGDLALLARSRPPLDWERVARLARRWGLERDRLAAEGILHRLENLLLEEPVGVSPRDREDAATGTRVAARLFPGLARTSPSLHLRPILVVEAVRHAFPGARWIRARYGLHDAGAWRLALRAGLHAGAVLIRLGRMSAAAAGEILGRTVRGAGTAGPPRSGMTRTGSDNYPLGASQEAQPASKVTALKSN
jgi:hypothetical protein